MLTIDWRKRVFIVETYARKRVFIMATGYKVHHKNIKLLALLIQVGARCGYRLTWCACQTWVYERPEPVYLLPSGLVLEAQVT